MSTLEKVYEVFGDRLPERHEYAATVAHPVSVLSITKEFRSWRNFAFEYNKYLQTKRATFKNVVTKAPKVEVKTNVIKQKV